MRKVLANFQTKDKAKCSVIHCGNHIEELEALTNLLIIDRGGQHKAFRIISPNKYQQAHPFCLEDLPNSLPSSSLAICVDFTILQVTTLDAELRPYTILSIAADLSSVR